MTKKRISCILELREILLSFQTGFNLVSAAVVCAILESISGLEPSSVITEPRYLKLVTVSRERFSQHRENFKPDNANQHVNFRGRIIRSVMHQEDILHGVLAKAWFCH